MTPHNLQNHVNRADHRTSSRTPQTRDAFTPLALIIIALLAVSDWAPEIATMCNQNVHNENKTSHGER